MHKYLCTHDGGQWNIPVETEMRSCSWRWEGLSVVRGLTSDLVGWVGTDGHCYTICHDDELFDSEQFDNIEERSNAVKLR